MHVDVGVCLVHVQHSVHSSESKSQYLILEAGEMVLVDGRKHLLNKYLHFKRCMTGLEINSCFCHKYHFLPLSRSPALPRAAARMICWLLVYI